MRRFVNLFFIFCSISTGAWAETIKLRSGGDIQGKVLSLDDRSISLDGGKTLPREDVEEIEISEQQLENSSASPIDTKAAQRGRALFRQAEQFEKRYPGVDGLVLLDEAEYRLKGDGTWTYRYRFAGKILKEGLKQSWGEVSSSFEEGRSRVKILNATVYHSDGKIFSLEPEKIGISKPQGEARFFTEENQIHYSLPQVEVGSIVEYETESETYNPFRKDFFFPNWGFQLGHPTLVSRVSISIPESQKLYYAVDNFTGPWEAHVNPKIEVANGEKTYSWELRNLPPIVGEPLMPPYWNYAPRLNAALFKDWSRIFDWLGQLQTERINPGPELAKFTADLVKTCKTDDDKVAAIYHYIQQDVRYIAVKLGIASGMSGFDANLTWKRRFGCCIDKALLFTAMLKVVGIKSSSIILNPNNEGNLDFRIPNLYFIHAITSVNVGGREFFLDSTGSDYRYPSFYALDHGTEVLNVFSKKIEQIPVPKPEDNLRQCEYSVELSSNGDAMVHFTTRFNGEYEGRMRGYYKSIQESERKKVFQDWINGTSPSAELLDYKLENLDDISKPFSFSLTYRLKDYPIRAGDLYIFKLPDFEQDFPEVALAKRRYDMDYETSFEEHYHYDVTLPAGFEPVSLLQPAKLSGFGETFEESCSTHTGHIVCDTDFSRSIRVYKTTDYSLHKSFLEKVSKLTKDRIFLRAGVPK